MYCSLDNLISKTCWSSLVNSINKLLLIMGDLNCNHRAWGSSRDSVNGRNILQTAEDLKLIFLNDGSPTRLVRPGGSKSVVDLSLASIDVAPKISGWTTISDTGSSDHFPILCYVGIPTQDFNQVSKMRNFKKADWLSFHEKLACIFSSFPIEDYENFIEYISSVADTSIPWTSSHNNKYHIAWWDDSCAHIIQKRVLAINTFKNSPSVENYIEAKKFIAKARKFLKLKRKISFRSFCSKLNRNTPLKDIWNKINKVSGSRLSLLSQLPPEEIAQEILTFLSPISGDFELLFSPLQYSENPISFDKYHNTFLSKTDSATGPDQVSYSMLRNLPHSGSLLLIQFFNECIGKGQVPLSWKQTVILPIVKHGKDKTDPLNYRPIALSS
ncbi:uncharacterized protein [Diabrotica undecimpunctata]|uniref:uncharacterized protein n=1 Tax=Diabrotica undecimpunctata TaxID=50387 RepID=UPI003B63DF43